MYLQSDCYAKRKIRECYIYMRYPVLTNLPYLEFVRPGRSDDVHSTVRFREVVKLENAVRSFYRRNCPLPREKVTDQPLRSTRSPLNLPPNDEELVLGTRVSKYRIRADFNARPSS